MSSSIIHAESSPHHEFLGFHHPYQQKSFCTENSYPEMNTQHEKRLTSEESNEGLTEIQRKRISFFKSRSISSSNLINLKRSDELNSPSTSEDADGVFVVESPPYSPFSDRSIDSDILSLTSDEIDPIITNTARDGDFRELSRTSCHNRTKERPPLFRRVKEVLDRRHFLQEQRVLALLSEERLKATFHPSIDRKSEQIFNQRYSGTPPKVFERLACTKSGIHENTNIPHQQQRLVPSNSNRSKHQHRRDAREKTSPCPNKPKRCLPIVQGSFLQRLEAFQKKKLERLKRLAEQEVARGTSTATKGPSQVKGFSETVATSEALTGYQCTSHSAALYDRHLQKQNTLKMSQKISADKELTFKPCLDKNSRRLAGDRNLRSLLQDSERRAMMIRAIAKQEKQNAQSRLEKILSTKASLNFTIQVARDSSRLYDAKIAEQKKVERQRQREEIERERLEKEMEHCTFKPVINPTSIERRNEKTIRGLERYFHRLAAARRLQDEELCHQRAVLNGRTLLEPPIDISTSTS